MKKLLLQLFYCSALLFLPAALLTHGVTPADQATLNQGGLWSYIYIGAKHMVTGYDHLLSLVGVISYLKNTKDILRFITVFTLGHSITLVGATYFGHHRRRAFGGRHYRPERSVQRV